MSLRLIKPGLSAATGMFHPTLRHPRTGELLEAVGVGKDGRPWWPILGAAPDDDEKDDDKEDEDEDSEDDEDEDSDDDDKDEKDDDKDKGKKGGLKARIRALEEEKDRHYKAKKKNEKELEELRKFKTEKENEGLSDADKAKKAAEESTAREREQAAELVKLKRERAFLVANEVNWYDREDALLAVDWDEVEVSEDGKVNTKSLRAELKRLAKAKPWLVKTSETDGDSDDEEGKKDSRSSSSMSGKTKKGKKELTREELAQRYPALRRG